MGNEKCKRNLMKNNLAHLFFKSGYDGGGDKIGESNPHIGGLGQCACSDPLCHKTLCSKVIVQKIR